MPLAKNTNVVVVPAKSQLQETNDIKPINTSLETLNNYTMLILLAGLLAALAGYFLYRKFSKKDKQLPVIIIPPHLRAKQRIEQAKRLIGDPRQFCFEISDALRIYLEERFSLRAPERTTDEFLLDLQKTSHLSPEQKILLADFLTRCDLVKFARYEPTEEDLLSLLDSALKLIDETAQYGENVASTKVAV